MGQQDPRRTAAALLLVLLSLSGTAVARAAESGIFTVSDVKVDATADTAAKAREIAIADGQRRALGTLLRRLVRREDQARLPGPSDARIAELVKALEIGDERISAVRYLAELTVHFKPADVRNLLRFAGLPFAETISKPVLVLPVYRVAGTFLLWEEPNPWRDAWARRALSNGLVPVVPPIGELEDIDTLSIEQVLNEDVAALGATARRYGAGDTLVAVAALGLDAETGTPGLMVIVRRYGESQGGATIVNRRLTAVDGGIDPLLNDAVRMVVEEVEEAWKRGNLLRFDVSGQLLVSIPLSGLKEWVEIRRRLGEVAAIRSSELKSLTRGQARLSLAYFGGRGQLELALAQKDLELKQEFASWLIRLRKQPRDDDRAMTSGSVRLPRAAEMTTGGASPTGQITDRPIIQNAQ